MSRLLDGYCRLLEWTIAIVLALMVLLVFDNVLLRYVANSGITVSEELSRWLLVWMMFLGAIVAVKKHGQLRDDGLVMVQESDDLAQVDALQLDRSATYKHENGASAMTVFIFLGSLLAVMALGVPIAYALLLSGVALMWHLDLFDAQILAQNVITGRAGGLIASAGIIAPVIPPSIGFVIFGGAANVSISKLFLAGIVPGLLMGASIALAWWWVAKTENVTPPKKASTAERLKALKESTWAMVLPVVVIVGLKFGVFTPTEAAVVAAVYALLVSTLVYRELPLHKLKDVFVSAAKTTAVIMFLVAAAMVSAWLITVADIPAKMIELLKPFMGNQTLLMTAIMVLVMAVGTAMDMTPTGLIMTPALVMVPARWVANCAGRSVPLAQLPPLDRNNGRQTMPRFFLKTLIASVALAACGLAAAQERSFKFALQNPKSHPLEVGASKFAELVAARRGGKLKINVFPGGTLGGDAPNVSALQGGTIEMVMLNSGILASQVKDFEVFDFPFIFANAKEADAVVDGPFGQKLHAKLAEKGIVGLAYTELGFRNITNSQKPITTVDDIAGLKLRVIPNAINVDSVKALGANPTPLAFPEVYAALEQKAIDGQENPLSVILANKLFEVQKYLVLSSHQYNPQSIIFSKKVWDTLIPADHTVLQDAAAETSKVQRQVARDAAASTLDALKKAGVQVTAMSPAEQAELREKLKPVIDKHGAAIAATVAELNTELARLRK